MEKSDDNKAFFEKDEQFAVGFSEGIVSYRFIDKNPTYGQNYYRLTYTDNDGKKYNGPVVSFKFSPLSLEAPIDQIKIYPNPTTDVVFVETILESPLIQLFDIWSWLLLPPGD